MLFLTWGNSTQASDSGSCDLIPLASVVGVKDRVRLSLGYDHDVRRDGRRGSAAACRAAVEWNSMG